MLTESDMDESTWIPNSSYNEEWLIKSLMNKDETFRFRLKETRITKISFEEVGTGKGFMSNVYKIMIDFANMKEPFVVCIKIPNIAPLVSATSESFNGGIAGVGSTIDQAHSRECDFYERFGDLHVLPLPKIYAVERLGHNGREGAVLMEYLAKDGAMLTMFDSLNADQLRSLTKFIAKLAAYSLSLPAETIEQYKPPKYFIETSVKVSKEMGPKAAEVYSSDLKELYKRIEHLFVKPHFTEYALTSINEELGLRPVLVHGDLWVNNIFWKKDEKEACSNDISAVIDWQVVHAGNIGYDMAVILVACTDLEVRRDAEKWIFNLLYDCVQDELRELGTTVPFSLGQINASYRRLLVCQAVQTFAFSPAVLSEAKTTEMQNRLLTRIEGMMEDALDILENDLTWWLDPDFVPKLCAYQT